MIRAIAFTAKSACCLNGSQNTTFIAYPFNSCSARYTLVPDLLVGRAAADDDTRSSGSSTGPPSICSTSSAVKLTSAKHCLLAVPLHTALDSSVYSHTVAAALVAQCAPCSCCC
eukprot:17456-Heterococcus_DN1.PRE.1